MATNLLVLDVSQFNPITSYKDAAKNVDGVIIRCGYRGYGVNGTLATDKSFKAHIEGFLAAGAKVGIYFLTTALNATEGAQEADYVHKLIKDYKITLPVFADSEYSNTKHDGRSDKITKTARTGAVKGFCDRIKTYGYIPGVYASDYWYVSKLNLAELTGYKLWVASYSYAPKRVSNYIGWQYTSGGKVDGITGRVDLSHWYEPIEEKKETTTSATKKTTGNHYKVPTTNVKKGSKGESVKWVQYELNEEGYKLDVDGDFGTKTDTATRDYQKKHGLTVDGIVGTNTINALKTNKKPVTTTTTVKTTTTTNNVNKLVKGAKITLTTAGLYSTSTQAKPVRKISGTFYVWNSTVYNKRIRISRKKDSKAITDVTGWVNTSDCKLS